MRTTQGFKHQLQQKNLLLGTFIKTPSTILTEVISSTTLDVICFDSEHAPFGRYALDQCLMTALLSNLPCLVRVQKNQPEYIQSALDCGATGVIVPHIETPQAAERAVSACYYTTGTRGYAGSTRNARYGCNTLNENIHINQQTTTVIAQIEDAEALDHLDAIMCVEGIDCFFIGIMDLTLSLGAAVPTETMVVDAIQTIIQAAMQYGRAVGMFLADPGAVAFWYDQGVRFFLIASEHTLLRNGIHQMLKTAQNIVQQEA